MKVAAVKSARQAFKVDIKVNGHITALMAISASGKVVPPYIVFSKNITKKNFNRTCPAIGNLRQQSRDLFPQITLMK